MKHSLLAAALFTVSAAALNAEIPEVYPVPQKIVDLKSEISIPAAKYEGKTDEDALKLLQSSIKEDASAKLTVKIREMPLPPGVTRDSIPLGYYTLRIDEKGVDILSYDNAASYYAAQTLSQLYKDGKLPCCQIVDWPDVPFRGTVEGFYGQPWSHAARLSQFEFYGRWKMNTYIYGPKDDPFHGFSTRWREPYPADKAVQIRELAETAKKYKVNFVWAVHPGRDIKWTQADLDSCVEKFQKMYDLGVRSFGVFFDDIGGEGAKAQGQVNFLNALNRRFIRLKPDVTPLIMCPTQYNRAWSGGDYLDILGTQLDSDIRIMWTGNSVVHNIGKADLEWVNKRIRRPAFIWWNFPVSDYVRDHLLLGRVYGLDTAARNDMSGFTSNPMDKPEASKIALFGIANYTWNMKDYNSDKSWRDGIKRLFPKCAEAMQLFADHNSDLGPNGHGYRREESVELAPLMERVLEQYGKDGKINDKDYKQISEIFGKMSQVRAGIRQGADNPAFLEEVSPWLDAFDRLSHAGALTLSAIDKNSEKNLLDCLGSAVDDLIAMETISETKNRNPHQPGVKTGSLKLNPFVHTLLRGVAARELTKVTGYPIVSVTPVTSSSAAAGIGQMIDGNSSSYYYCKEIQKVGDWYGLDLGALQRVERIDILMGRHDGDHDIVHKGILEISDNGERWVSLGEFTGERIAWKATPVMARFVRYRSTHAGKLDGSKKDVWTAFRNFAVNGSELAVATSSVPAYKAPQLRANDKEIAINRIMEVAQMSKGEAIGIFYPRGIRLSDVRNFRLNFELKEQHKKIAREVSLDGKTWSAYDTADKTTEWKYVRAVCVSDNPIDIKLNEFKLELKKGGLGGSFKMTDGDLTTASKFAGEIRVPVTTSKVLLFGEMKNLEFVNGTITASNTGYGMITLPANTTELIIKSKTDDGATISEILPCK